MSSRHPNPPICPFVLVPAQLLLGCFLKNSFHKKKESANLALSLQKGLRSARRLSKPLPDGLPLGGKISPDGLPTQSRGPAWWLRPRNLPRPPETLLGQGSFLLLTHNRCCSAGAGGGRWHGRRGAFPRILRVSCLSWK